MKIVLTALVEIAALILIGLPCVYVFWKVFVRTLTLAEFVDKYGELLAYVSLLFFAVVFILIHNVFDFGY